MILDHVDLARQTLSKIGTGWEATHDELETLDFKETPETAMPASVRAKRNMGREHKAFLTTIAETAACLSNARGGVVVVGVRDRAPTRIEALQGASPADYTPEAIRLAVHRATNPPLSVDVVVHEEDGKRVLLIRVPTGAVVHGTSGGTYKHRVGDQCLPLAATEMRGLQASRGQYDWSAEVSRFDSGSLSVAAMARAAERLRGAGADEQAALAETDPEQFLANCELLEGRRLRRAAVLLYGAEEALRETVADWGAIMTSADTPGGEGSVILRREDAARRPIVLIIDDILVRIGALASTESIRVGAAAVEMVDYPGDVVRELAANAFAHRDWELPGIIEIAHSPDELVISSPGGLLPTLHADRLLRETAQRNRLLAREIARLHIAEGAGLGFDRVWRLLASLGKEPPTIASGLRFTVTVQGGRGDQVFARFLQGPAFPADRRIASDLDVLLTLSALRRRRTVTAPAIAPLIQRDEASTQRVLERMRINNLVEPTRGTMRRAHPSYRLARGVLVGLRGALTYRVETIDSDDAKLIRHLKRHRRISNEDVRSYLDCDVATARNRLTRMRKKGWIEFAPDSPRRGPNVEYVASQAIDSVTISQSHEGRATPGERPIARVDR